MGWLLLIVVVVIFAIAFRRGANHNYRIGSGMFKSSEDNLDEKDNFPDKDYYDKDGLMK